MYVLLSERSYIRSLEVRPLIINVPNSNSLLLQRWPFTAGFIGSMAGTIYVSMVLHSYILSVVFAAIQVNS